MPLINGYILLAPASPVVKEFAEKVLLLTFNIQNDTQLFFFIVLLQLTAYGFGGVSEIC